VQLHGTLQFHGLSHPCAVPARVTLDGDRVTATGELDVPYVDWGLRDPSFFVLRVAKEVKVELRVAGRLSGPVPGREAAAGDAAARRPAPGGGR
jgi:YceI-like domain